MIVLPFLSQAGTRFICWNGMIKAYKIYTDLDGHTRIIRGSVAEDFLSHAHSIRFKETAAYAFYDWHPAPSIQYVITLTGTLEFTTFLGETFILKAGEVLLAMDTTGTGHKWKLVDDQPWKRAYVSFDADKEMLFVEDR